MKKKVLVIDVLRSGKVVFSSPFGSPDIVIGFLSTFNVPENDDLSLVIHLNEIVVTDEKENN